ncbi:MAG: NnrS family protein [Halofilum sp. (in: g-proteobacteria)]
MSDGGRRHGEAARRSRGAAEGLFFPVAAIYAALVVPLSVHGMRSGEPLLPGFATAGGHAHELLFGFALAVAAGFLVTRATPAQRGALVALWLAGRVAFLTWPGSVLAFAANFAFAALLGALVIPQFLRGAKKLRNRTIGPLLSVLCLAVLVFHVAGLTARTWLQWLVLHETVLLFATLMLFMGGRIIAPAAAGAIQRAGGHLEARVQPRIEGGLLIAMIGAVSLSAVPGGRAMAGACAGLAGLLAVIRLARWRLPACRGRPDLWCLGLGYAWLGGGLVLFGVASITGSPPFAAAIHAITVGALGTLTSGVMARVRLTRLKRDPGREWSLPWMALLITAAAAIRISGVGGDFGLGLSAVLWSGAFVLLLTLFVRVPARRGDRRAVGGEVQGT